MQIQKEPVTVDGKVTTPVAWESGCLEEVCGSCSMLINGRPRQACTALIENLLTTTNSSTVTLAPLTKFPLVRDLVVDRTQMFENLKRVQAWVEVDDYFDRGGGLTISQEKQEVQYALSQCMTCGCCSEACPQVNSHSEFMGPAPIAQVRLFSIHPTARKKHKERIRVMQTDAGVGSCGNAQNCVRVCPKNVPLTDAIAAIGRDTLKVAIEDLFGLPERSD
jgi:succinate dehydrogenase / fumarate reductase iron-sulfur subunit